MVRPWKMDKHVSRAFTVIRHLDLNILPPNIHFVSILRDRRRAMRFYNEIYLPQRLSRSPKLCIAVADPGFSVGGAPTRWGGGGGGADLRRVHFSVKTYVKTKEIDPVGGGGGGRRQRPLDPPMHCKLLSFIGQKV